MSISAMGAVMGLNVVAFERRKVGGECLNIGCIPSKSILSMAHARYITKEFSKYGLFPLKEEPIVNDSLDIIRKYLVDVQKAKMFKIFKKCEVHLNEGDAYFESPTVVVSKGIKYTAKKIFINTGSQPMIPNIPGLKELRKDILTNENIFDLKKIPKSMLVVGGGAIGSELSQAFSRLGTKVNLFNDVKHLVNHAGEDASVLVEQQFKKEGINVMNDSKITKIEKDEKNNFIIHTTKGKFIGEKLLVSAGRKINTDALKLKNANVQVNKNGTIKVNEFLETTQRNIYSCGDVNGIKLFSHAAMHQGMLGLINSMIPGIPFSSLMKRKNKNYAIPWTIFTDPEISCVGLQEQQLKEKNIKFDTIETTYKEFGGALAIGHDVGFIKVYVSKITGRIYGAKIVGHNSGEMINFFGLAIQNKMRMANILFNVASFPTMGFMIRRTGELWMQGLFDRYPFFSKITKTIYKLK